MVRHPHARAALGRESARGRTELVVLRVAAADLRAGDGPGVPGSRQHPGAAANGILLIVSTTARPSPRIWKTRARRCTARVKLVVGKDGTAAHSSASVRSSQ